MLCLLHLTTTRVLWCRYHHPEPQGHQWAMVTQAPFMYAQPGMLPYLPPMAPPALMRSSSGDSMPPRPTRPASLPNVLLGADTGCGELCTMSNLCATAVERLQFVTNTGYSETSASMTSISGRSLSSVPSSEEQQANPQVTL